LIKLLIACGIKQPSALLLADDALHQPPEISTQAFGLFYAACNGSYNDRDLPT
jgi:hypothetical protein